jgi:hypothetical protein
MAAGAILFINSLILLKEDNLSFKKFAELNP